MSHKLSSFYLFSSRLGLESAEHTMIHNSIVNSMGCQYKFSIYLLHITWMWINNTRMYWSHSAMLWAGILYRARLVLVEIVMSLPLSRSLYLSRSLCPCVGNIDSSMLIFCWPFVRGVPARIVTSYLIYFCHFSRFTLVRWCCCCSFFPSTSTSVSKSNFHITKKHMAYFQCVHIFHSEKHTP